MSIQYFDHSNAVKAAKGEYEGPTLWARIQETFEGCPGNKSFAVTLLPHEKENYLRSLISKKAREYNRKYTVVKHAEGTFEIARIATQAPLGEQGWAEQ